MEVFMNFGFLKGKDFLTLRDFSAQEILSLLDLAS